MVKVGFEIYRTLLTFDESLPRPDGESGLACPFQLKVISPSCACGQVLLISWISKSVNQGCDQLLLSLGPLHEITCGPARVPSSAQSPFGGWLVEDHLGDFQYCFQRSLWRLVRCNSNGTDKTHQSNCFFVEESVFWYEKYHNLGTLQLASHGGFSEFCPCTVVTLVLGLKRNLNTEHKLCF